MSALENSARLESLNSIPKNISLLKSVYADDSLDSHTETLPKPTIYPTLTKLNPTASPQIIPQKNTINPTVYDGMFETYGREKNVDPTRLKNIAHCESRFNPNAQNGIYGGIFQFAPATWISNRKAMNLDPNLDLRFNPEEAIKTAAYKIAKDGTGAWPICGRI